MLRNNCGRDRFFQCVPVKIISCSQTGAKFSWSSENFQSVPIKRQFDLPSRVFEYLNVNFLFFDFSAIRDQVVLRRFKRIAIVTVNPNKSKAIDVDTTPNCLSCRHEKQSGILCTPIRYVTFHFSDRRGAASLRYRNRAEITAVFIDEQKPYPEYDFWATTGYKFHRFSSDIWNRMMFCAFWKWQMELGGFFLKLYSDENSLIEVWNVRGPYFDV